MRVRLANGMAGAHLVIMIIIIAAFFLFSFKLARRGLLRPKYSKFTMILMMIVMFISSWNLDVLILFSVLFK